jgi:hypothetical protein
MFHARIPARALLVAVALLVVSCAMYGPSRTSVWVENRSSEYATFFVTDLSDGPSGWYIVPAHTTAHAGSTGLRFSAVVANVLGWGHEANHVSNCSPGDYDDTLYDVPDGSSVRLLIDETGRPSVSLAPEPPGLPQLALAPLGSMSEADRCQYIDTHH